jgi:hypothetical protein
MPAHDPAGLNRAVIACVLPEPGLFRKISARFSPITLWSLFRSD